MLLYLTRISLFLPLAARSASVALVFMLRWLSFALLWPPGSAPVNTTETGAHSLLVVNYFQKLDSQPREFFNL